MTLPDRQFELGDVVAFVSERKRHFRGTVVGYQDGRDAHRRVDEWIYHVRVEGAEIGQSNELVPESALKRSA